ncbi:MAG: hypothetical protein ACFFD4_24765, partial [Candidatus Odinarchaeota archaeon]
WLISDKGQSLIDSYKINGEQLFFADFKNHIDEMPSDELDFWGLPVNTYLVEMKRCFITNCVLKEDG